MVTRWHSFSSLPFHDRWYRIGFVVLLFALYGVGYKIFFPRYEATLGSFFFGAFLTIPVIAAAWLLGLRAGLAALAVSLPLEILLLIWCGDPPLHALLDEGGILGFGLLLFAVIPVGQFYDLKHRLALQPANPPKAEEALFGSPRFVHEVMEHIPDMVYIHDMEANSTIYINHAVTTVLGYTPEALIAMGSKVDEIILHPDDVATIAEDVRQKLFAAKDEEVILSEYRAKHADGQWRTFSTQEVVFLRNGSGTPKQLLGIAQDVTERKKAAEALLEKERLRVSLEKERELSQLKNRLMVTLSHEFRTPLSIILASNELLERYMDQLTPARRAECLATVKTQIMHLREMLDDITTLVAESDFGARRQANFRPDVIDLSQAVQQIVDSVRASIGSNYMIEFSAEGELNAVHADSNLLRTILRNLLSNAVKYSHPGQTIHCGLSRQGDEALLTIRDDGIGIPRSEQSRIFETFHRASNALNTGGLGLGLRIVRDYVKLHGGTIQIDSEEGKGTTVTVRLPVVMKPVADSEHSG